MDPKDLVNQSLRRKVHAAGYYSQQLRSGHWDGTVEFLVEAMLELQGHIEGEEERGVPDRYLASAVGRHLGDFAREVHRARPSARNGEAYDDAPLQDPSRAWPCRQAANALDRGNVTFDTLLEALRAVLDEAVDRSSAVREAEDEAEHASAEVSRLEDDLDDADARIDNMISEVAGIVGSDPPDSMEWQALVEHLRDLLPKTCPVPRCSDSVLRRPVRRADRDVWPPDLCERHTAKRYDGFSARVGLDLPNHAGPTHAALVPLPALAHLAPSPEDLADPPGPNVWRRLLEDDGT